MRICAKANLMILLKHLNQLLQVYDHLGDIDKQEEIKRMIDMTRKLYFEE